MLTGVLRADAAAPAPAPQPPHSAAGEDGPPGYDLIARIAQGGMGVVWKARHRRLDRLVALKMILGDRPLSATEVRRFEQEARAAAALDHPNIVPIYEIGEHRGRPYYAMAFVAGGTLTGLVRRRGVPPPAEAAALLAAVADGVAYAHGRGVVHRDLKPDNVLLDEQGRPRVTDFGLAKVRTDDVGLTGTGQVLGTPSYMPPEQAMGRLQDIGPASDVYALGGILYFLLTGQAPFTGKNLTEVLLKVTQEPPRPPREWVSTVPPELEAACLRCLEKETARRFASAEDFAAAVRAWLQGKAPAVAPAAPVPAPSPQATTELFDAPRLAPRRSRRLAWGATVVVALSSAVAGAAWFGPWWGSKTTATSPGPKDDGPAREGTSSHFTDGILRESVTARSLDGMELTVKVQNAECWERYGEFFLLVKKQQPPSFEITVGQKAHVSIMDGTVGNDDSWRYLFPPKGNDEAGLLEKALPKQVRLAELSRQATGSWKDLIVHAETQAVVKPRGDGELQPDDDQRSAMRDYVEVKLRYRSATDSEK
jgi:tRNA A-37 threonylcarbamoyl transferase component Bud32